LSFKYIVKPKKYRVKEAKTRVKKLLERKVMKFKGFIPRRPRSLWRTKMVDGEIIRYRLDDPKASELFERIRKRRNNPVRELIDASPEDLKPRPAKTNRAFLEAYMRKFKPKASIPRKPVSM